MEEQYPPPILTNVGPPSRQHLNAPSRTTDNTDKTPLSLNTCRSGDPLATPLPSNPF